MEAFQERMINEFKELNDRVEKMWNFVHKDPKFEELDKTERKLLLRQLTGMSTYLDALEDRLEYYKIKVED